MAKKTNGGGMHAGKDRKHRGRSSISKPIEPSPTHPMVPEAQLTQVNRAVTANGNMNKHRGDRRDMSKTYAGNERHASRGNSARPDVSTRKR
jgi:hypothetical protein